MTKREYETMALILRSVEMHNRATVRCTHIERIAMTRDRKLSNDGDYVIEAVEFGRRVA